MVVVQASYGFGPGDAGADLLGTGWCSPGADGVWSTGADSVLEVPIGAGSGRVWLDLRLDPQAQFAITRYCDVSVSVNGAEAATRRWGGGGNWRVAVQAGHAAGIARVMLRVRPHQAEATRGVRLCGLDVLRDTHATPASPVRAMTEVRFGWNETTETLLQGGGWGAPEDAFVWAIGAESVLSLPVPPAGFPITVLMDMRPHTRDGSAALQRVAIFADGVQVAALDLWQRLCVAIDLHPSEGQSRIELGFRNRDAGYVTSDPYFHFGKPFAWALASIRILPALPRYLASGRPRVRGELADGSMQDNVAALTQMDAADIVAAYESLGNGCELGFLQRDVRRSRPALLQFAAIRQRELVEGIFAGFNGVGRRDRLHWDVRRPEDETWRLIEASYGLSCTTTHSRFVTAPARGFAEAAARLPRLADKLMEDIAAGDKVFLMRFSEHGGMEVARAVLAALRYFGDADMVWLVTDGSGVPGSAERLEQGLIRGHVDVPRPGQPESLDTLMSVLANAFVLLRQARKLPAERSKAA